MRSTVRLFDYQALTATRRDATLFEGLPGEVARFSVCHKLSMVDNPARCMTAQPALIIRAPSLGFNQFCEIRPPAPSGFARTYAEQWAHADFGAGRLRDQSGD